ncbi:hypothetical protein EJB05_56773, partial [Eragrostis curvula]
MLPSELLIFHQQQKLSLTPIEGRAALLDSWSQDMEDTADLLTPYKMGEFNLAHRVVLAPVTRCRSYENLAQPHNALYYEQRAAPGVLLIAEASAVSETATGSGTRAASHPLLVVIKCFSHFIIYTPLLLLCDFLSSRFWNSLVHSHIKIDYNVAEFGAPTRMDPEEIPQMVMDFRVAARNAIGAGFDGVEIHAANGFLINQFWWFLDIGRVNSQPLRLDQLTKDNQLNGGSSLDNACCRFATDVVAAVVDELGVLYCHMVEPRKCINGDNNGVPHRLSLFRKAFRGTFIVNGGYDREEGDRVIRDGYADLVSYGRLFLANPDLPERFRKKAGLNKYDRSTFYTSDPVVGYTDYPFLGQETQVA